MSTVTFDTLEFTRKLRDAGFDEKQAETVVRVLAESQEKLVTREHFDFRMDVLGKDMQAQELRLTIKLGGLIAAGVGIVAAILKLG
ncbi:hypothetical protein [Thauera chlorobenzoica]|uniref:Uncharacterized protein n=1 Tax=Thauera chlorobenzoica TaxID=96773 RepID=A0A1H5ZE35_9RHOO|nr:hypothetical protein [Thauera chlorobenzoica]APR03269.1 hypothetical protein Tchl_0397 [Thauera chlorobenzoica]SEG34739.1 hypothetical protein SAMN05216242_1528 [Thauera chlorobenzoica]